MMKMVMAVVPRDQAEDVLAGLISAGYTATFSESRGGVLRQAQKMLFIAVNAEDLEQVLSVIHDNCRTEIAVEPGESEDALAMDQQPVLAEVGGAVVFVWDLERFETY